MILYIYKFILPVNNNISLFYFNIFLDLKVISLYINDVIYYLMVVKYHRIIIKICFLLFNLHDHYNEIMCKNDDHINDKLFLIYSFTFF